MLNQPKYDLHIGESSWDLQCIKSHGFNPKKSFLHNDFFNENRNSLTRLKRFLVIFYLVFKSACLNQRIIFTSINSDSMLVQFLFIWYKKSIFILPNILGYKTETNFGSIIYRYLIKKYKSRVIATDEVTYFCLKDFDVSVVKNPFKLNPPLKWHNKYNYLVIFPTPGTHKDLRDQSDTFFNFYLELFDLLYKKFTNVYIVIHPRDRGETISSISKLRVDNKLYLNRLVQGDLSDFEADKTIYISGLSSLCLNRRYGAYYGTWCSIKNRNILKDEFKQAEIFLTDVFEIIKDDD